MTTADKLKIAVEALERIRDLKGYNDKQDAKKLAIAALLLVYQDGGN